MAQQPDVSFRVDEGVAYVCLDRPAVHNALSPGCVLGLMEAWQTISRDPGIKVAILHASGESFCSGRDLRQTDLGFGPRTPGGEPASADHALLTRPGEARRAHYVPPATLYKPVIAAVQGLALGGGLELALGCDIRLATRGARFGLPEVTRAVVPGSGGMYWLPRLVGMGLAMEMLLTGRIIDADEALAMRLVNRVVERDELMPAARTLAHAIAAQPPLAVQAIKEAVWRTLGAGLEEGLRMGEHQNRVLQFTHDAAEGARAFEERRAPRYEGR
jgi:enoyl-CoA hydratase/carnithine racemase